MWARMCARRLTRPSSMTMRSASARASGFLPWSFPRRARAAACRHLGHAAAVTLRSPRRLRRSPEDAPLHPAGALVNRTSPADGRGASSAGGTRHGPAGAARDPRRVGRASPGLARHERGPTDGAPGTGRVLRRLLATACELPTRGSVSAGPVRSAPSGTTGGPGRSLVPGVTLRRHTPRLGRHRPDPKGASAGQGRSAGSRRPGFDGGQLAARGRG